MRKFDYIVIGTGAANIVTDAAIDAGKTVAMIEKAEFGGTCLNRGCIPTKSLLTPIDYKKDFERLKEIGLIEGEFKINYEKLKERTFHHSHHHSQLVFEEYQAEENVSIYQGEGFFTGEKTLQVRLNDGTLSEELMGDQIVIANGAKTRIPNTIKGLEQIDYLTTEKFFGNDFPEKPFESLTILGGGVIAAEFAHFFANLGTKVTIVQHNPRFLPHYDKDVIDVVLDEYKEENIDVYLHVEMLDIKKIDGQLHMTIENIDTGEQTQIVSEQILLAIGLESNSKSLQVEKAGIETDKRGWIKTNEFLETSADGIYCMGDANGKFQLRHVANYEAEIIAFNLFERFENHDKSDVPARRRARYDVVPAAVFTGPQVAMVGLNRKQIEQANIDVVEAKYYYGYTSKPFAMGYEYGEEKHFVKVLADRKTHRLLGVQIVGPEASVLTQIYANLMNSGQYTYQIIEGEIASEETKKERVIYPERYIDPTTTTALNYAMTIHPALSEVATWAASEIDFEEIIKNEEIQQEDK